MAIAIGNFVEQNLGMLDRVMRVIIGTVMLAVPYYLITQEGATVQAWHSWTMVLSVYPFLSGILGADPIYNMMGKKSCDLSDRNRCGSFPFQVDAFMGHKPIPEDDYEHTLEHSRHDKLA